MPTKPVSHKPSSIQRNKPKHNWSHTKTTTQRGYGYAWQKLRKVILARDYYLCQPCKRKGLLTEASEVDHIKEKANGGTDDPDNLQAICTPCHRAKTGAGKKSRPLGS